MKYQYRPRGVCSYALEFELENGAIHNAHFEGGCHGNLQGICSLVEGMSAQQVVERLKGIRCGRKNTSCPDQFAKALEQVLAEQPVAAL